MTTARPARVLVTRPAEQAGPWVERLRERGIVAEALPLIEIAPPADASALRSAWAGLAACRLVVFVSANAVLHFFAERPAGLAWPEGVDAGAPGSGTADALREAGVPPPRSSRRRPTRRSSIPNRSGLACRRATGAARASSSFAATAAATGSPSDSSPPARRSTR